MTSKFIRAILLSIFLAASAAAQTGGGFTIEKSLIASGGGKSMSGAVTVEGTTGQPAAGNAQGGAFSIVGGFVPAPLAPTAASVSVGGRITTSAGKGIRNISVTLTDSSSATRTTLTGAFGAYRFDDVPVGETYILSVSGRRFNFTNPAQIVNVVEQLDALDFVGTELW